MKTLLLGIILTFIFWGFSWTRIAPIHEHSFFPLWLGYILTINGTSELLFGNSILKRMGLSFILLFFISVPFWWMFEFFNSFVQNWRYVLPDPNGPVEYFIRASIYFSTVIPAVLSTSFLFFQILKKIKFGEITHAINIRPIFFIWILGFSFYFLIITFPNFINPVLWLALPIILYFMSLMLKPLAKSSAKFSLNIYQILLFWLVGITCIVLTLTFPRIAYPLIWLGIFLILDPTNYLLKTPSLLAEVINGRWRTTIAFSASTLFTGFWWELWNFYSLPKWTYSIPYVEFFKVFEMPIFGYIGYIFFGLEILSFSILILGIVTKLFRLRVLIKSRFIFW